MKMLEGILLSALLISLLVVSFGSPVTDKTSKEGRPASSLKSKEGKDEEVEQLQHLKNQILEDEIVINDQAKEQKNPSKSSDNISKESAENTDVTSGGKDKKSDIHHELEKMKQATPEELALYVARTGDEDGVSLIIQEMVSENVITVEEAAIFLDKVRRNLRFLKEEQLQNQESTDLYQNKRTLPPGSDLGFDSDYESLLEKLGTPTLQDSYDEVIYQMAKMILLQADEGSEGDVGIERALKEISLILSKEVERGSITQAMQKKVIDLVVTALTDMLANPENDSSLYSNSEYFGQETDSRAAKVANLLQSPILTKTENSRFLPPFSSLKIKRDTEKA